ncbi:MAG TPA: hypothetical protein VFJ47_16725, partial [Terriglobales bacterium]|nr:hypothetical protein [Terriglobales bacterium]
MWIKVACAATMFRILKSAIGLAARRSGQHNLKRTTAMKNEIQEVMRKEALEVAKEKCIVISCLDGTAFCERDAMPAGTPVVADSLAHLSDDDVIKGWGSLMDARAKVVAAHDMPTAWGKRIPYCRAEVIWIYGILCERIHPQKAAKLLVRAIRKADEDRGKPHFQDMYGDQWRMLRRIARAKDNKEIFHLMNPDVSGLGEAQNVTTTDGETMTM